MKLNSKNEESENIQTGVKQKKRKGNININDHVEKDETNKLKRTLSYNGSEIPRKRKAKNLSENNVEDNNYSLELNNGTVSKSQENKVKHLNSVTDEESNNKNEESIYDQNECLNGKFLRKCFSIPNNSEMLKKFVKLCNENKEKDLAAEYLSAGGNILEILKILNTAEKKDISIAVTVFSCIRILIMKILAQYPQYQPTAEGACRHLINSHLPLIHSMLSTQSSVKQRKVVLQLLAAMVSLGGSLQRELLTHLSIPKEVIKSLVQHTKPTDKQNIRNCFIYFISAFLIEGNVQVIKILLDKRDLFSSIFPDLIYDSKEIVCLVITTLKTYILQNSNVTKTMKLHIFSTPIIQNIVRLYNWKGPNNWSRNKVQSILSTPEHLEDKEIVIDVVHDFLIMLLTSHRYGIIFHDHMFGTSHIKHNNLVNTVIQSLDRVWEHRKPAELVIKIMAACPDLIKSQFTILEPYIKPRISTKWIAAIAFGRQIINSVDVETFLKTCSMELNPSQLVNAIMSLSFPGVLLKHAVIPSLTHVNIIVRHEAILTLLTMFRQVQKYLVVIKEVYNENSDFYTVKSYILDSLIKTVPNVNTILKVWTSVSVSDSYESDNLDKERISLPSKHGHLKAVLDLLHTYNEMCPKLLDTSHDMELDTFLNILNELDNINIAEFNILKIKAIQFLISLNPNEFSPQKKIFRKTLSFLISLLNKEASLVSSSAEVTIKTLLNATRMFEGCDDHLDIWINGFINLDDKKDVMKWFISAIKETVVNIERYANEIMEAENSVNHDIIFGDRVETLFKEFMEKDEVSGKSENAVLRMQRFTSISPLLCCMLHRVEADLHPTIILYLSYVLIHTMYYQVTPQCLIHLSKDVELPVKEYLLSWSEDNQLTYLKKNFPLTSLISKFNSVLLSDTKLQLNEIFSGSNEVSFQYNDEDITIHHSLSTYEITYLFKMIIFYLIQFIKRRSLTKIQNHNYRILLISLLHLAKNNPNDSTFTEKCATFIFTHPVLLYYFSPFYENKKDPIRSMVTLMIVDICNVVIRLCNKCNTRDLFLHFKKKLITVLCKMIDKHKRGEKISDPKMISSMIESLQLTSQNVVYLCKKLMGLESAMFISIDEMNLSLYGHIIPKLLEIASSDEMGCERFMLLELDAQFIKCLFSHLLFLKLKSVTNPNINFEIWEISLYKYISKFPFNIVDIDANTFKTLLLTKMTDITVMIISFLISKNAKFMFIFTEYMMKCESIKEVGIVFPVMSNNLSYKWNRDFLQKLKKYHEAEILAYLYEPKSTRSWIDENVAAITYLIKNTFDFTTCSKTCNSILQIGDKLEVVSIQYIQVLQSLYDKCVESEENGEQFIMNWAQVLLHVITLTLKKDSKNIQKLVVLCELLNDVIKQLKNKKKDFVFEELSNNNSWAQFTRFSLKLGFKELKSNKEPVSLLKLLCTLCNVAYKNNSGNEYAKTLFEMTTSHSEFINIILESSDRKRDLIELLWVLMQKNNTVLTLTHIPVYLAAYNATLSETDQYILLILQYYETNGINIYEYRPYIWGNVAAVHYSVKGEMHMNLWRQPSITQVLDLFEVDKVNSTIQNYPTDRALKCNELYKQCDVYDPAFYLPLVHFLFSENNVVSCQKVAQSGALALTFAACSSTHSDVRMLAYAVIARYYTHLEASRSKPKLLWMRLIDAMRFGVESLEIELSNVRLNSFVSIFLARTSLVSTQPINPLYPVLQTFLMAKPALDINKIPELLQLFNSSDMTHKTHRYWILEIIRDGMKTENELNIAFKCALFKMVFDFYTSNLADSDAKILILEIIDATLKINKGSILLIESHGLLSWLLGITIGLNRQKVRYIELMVEIMDKILNTILNIKGDTIQYKLMLLNVALNLRSHLSKDIKSATFTLYINILQKLLLLKSMRMIDTKRYVIEILELSKKFFGNIPECDDILHFGCEYISETDCSPQDEIAIAKNSVRILVWQWKSTN